MQDFRILVVPQFFFRKLWLSHFTSRSLTANTQLSDTSKTIALHCAIQGVSTVPVVPGETMKGPDTYPRPFPDTFADTGTIYAADRELRRRRIRVN